MPYVSIVVPTMRIGGLDILLHGLDGQTFRDFELVLVDAIHSRRKDIVAAEAAARDYGITHVEPIGNPFPVNAFCRYANTGLVHARGEVVLFATDYTWFPPDCVRTHAEFHSPVQDSGQALMCPHQYVSLPPLHPDFKPYDKPDIDAYVADLESGRLDGMMMSILAEPFSADARQLGLDPVYKDADPKLRAPAGGIDRNMFHAKNESCRLERVLRINGWDEDLDGAHCYQDSDIADRLCVKSQIFWQCDPSNVAYIVNPRPVFPFPRRPRDVASNLAIWNSKKGAGYPDPVNSWSLSEARAEALGGAK